MPSLSGGFVILALAVCLSPSCASRVPPADPSQGLDDYNAQAEVLRDRLTRGQNVNATYSGGDGSDCAHAVVILGADTPAEGIEAQRIWLNKQFPGFTYQGSARGACDPAGDDRNDPKRICDVVRIRTRQAGEKSLCFDITDYYRKGKGF
jgi:hypothetical protein